MHTAYCHFYVVRHGETPWNALGKIQGHTDINLNQAGLDQAHKLQERLRSISFSGVFSSDLKRARETANIILKNRNVKINDTSVLRERFFDVWEGRLLEEFKEWSRTNNPVPSITSKEGYLNYKASDNVESYSEVFKRVEQLLKEQAKNYFGQSVLIATHGGVLRSLLYHLDFIPNREWKVSNCALLILQVNDKGEIAIIEREDVSSVPATSNP